MCVGRVVDDRVRFMLLPIGSLITHSAILKYFICLIYKCDCYTAPAPADKCKGLWVEEAMINTRCFSAGPIKKKKGLY